jgi:hypothetical protein
MPAKGLLIGRSLKRTFSTVLRWPLSAHLGRLPKRGGFPEAVIRLKRAAGEFGWIADRWLLRNKSFCRIQGGSMPDRRDWLIDCMGIGASDVARLARVMKPSSVFVALR